MRFISFVCIIFLSAICCQAQVSDPFDPLDSASQAQFDPTEDPDAQKSAEELLHEAILLQQGEHLLDARSKLLKAVRKNPDDYRIHLTLSDYYLRHVGHFRLALKYILQAEHLLIKKNGNPPYPRDSQLGLIHADILMLLSQARLNLDNYSAALKALERFENAGYFSASLASSKAWILMKLGRLQEAIAVARAGLLAGAQPGHTLNILGILLSMTGERQSSLDVFKEALRYELSLGSYGNPSTPLNNSGEVYKEIFSEREALRAWQRAVQLPDGCEHVLPSLNLALLYVDLLQLGEAKQAIDNFESCFAQFPLRNGEEHKALVHLARGRIALHAGNIETAITHFRSGQKRQQWFGKIGTNLEDLKVALHASLAQALRIQNYTLQYKYFESWTAWLAALHTRAMNRIEIIWLRKKARTLLSKNLNLLEDLYIRHTDSLIEYPTFGTLLSTFPKTVISTRIQDFQNTDGRREASFYYQLYLAEIFLEAGDYSKAQATLEELLKAIRPGEDMLLKAHLLALKLRILEDPLSYGYIKTSYELMELSTPEVRNYGVILTVNHNTIPPEIKSAIETSNIRLSNERKLPLQIQYSKTNSFHSLSLLSELQSVGGITVKATSIEEVVNKFVTNLFSNPNFSQNPSRWNVRSPK